MAVIKKWDYGGKKDSGELFEELPNRSLIKISERLFKAITNEIKATL